MSRVDERGVLRGVDSGEFGALALKSGVDDHRSDIRDEWAAQNTWPQRLVKGTAGQRGVGHQRQQIHRISPGGGWGHAKTYLQWCLRSMSPKRVEQSPSAHETASSSGFQRSSKSR